METIITALISAAAAIVVCLIQGQANFMKQQAEFDKAIDIIKVELKALTDKVDKHNHLIERTYELEKEVKVQSEKIGNLERRLDDDHK